MENTCAQCGSRPQKDGNCIFLGQKYWADTKLYPPGVFFQDCIRFLDKNHTFVTGRRALPQSDLGGELKVLFDPFSFKKKD